MEGKVSIKVLESPEIPSLETGVPDIDSYFKKAWEERQCCNSVPYILSLDGVSAGYAAVSMKSLHVKLNGEEKVYPALLLGRLGIDKQFQGKEYFEGSTGGVFLLRYVVGLAQEVGTRVGCRLVILDTDSERLEQYYHDFGFETAKKTKKRITMFLDICETLNEPEN